MTNEQLNFLRDIYLHQREQRSVFDTKASFLIGVSGIIFALSISRMDKMSFTIIVLASLTALILNIWAVSFPFPRASKGLFSLLSWSMIREMSDVEYQIKIKELFNNEEKIIQEYLKEIYALSKYSIEPKAKLVKISSFILSLSLLLGLILLTFGF